MNQEAVLAVLPDSKDDAKSLKEIANEMGLDITAYVDWIRVERRLQLFEGFSEMGLGGSGAHIPQVALIYETFFI